MIVYARRNVVVHDVLAVLRTPTKQEDFADLPHPGERIDAGRPILTLFADGDDVESCVAALRRRAAEVEASLYPD